MAEKIRRELIDDLVYHQTNGEKEVPADETIRFGWLGDDYEIDLAKENAEAFQALVEVYLQTARKVKHTRKRSRASRERSSEIRAWAAKQGIEVSERGRIPASVVAQYEAAH